MVTGAAVLLNPPKVELWLQSVAIALLGVENCCPAKSIIAPLLWTGGQKWLTGRRAIGGMKYRFLDSSPISCLDVVEGQA